MITAVDTNVLLDILEGEERFAPSSLRAVEQAAMAGSLVICDLVYAELSAHFGARRDLERFLDENGISVQSLDRGALFRAGRAWRAYREAGGSRARILPDFFIGAHAESQCTALVSRDRGFYRARAILILS
jgi:predicted nucleic acid-binding protein